MQTADRRVYAVRFHSPPDCERPVVGSPVLVHLDDPVPGQARRWTEITRVAARDPWIRRWYLLPAGLAVAGVLLMGAGFRRLSRAAGRAPAVGPAIISDGRPPGSGTGAEGGSAGGTAREGAQ